MSTASPPEPKIRVFVVEDNEDTRLLLTCLLESAGYEVRAACTMQAALREFSQSGSDVLLSDVGLPDGNGCELLRELRRGGACPYAIAMSGFGTLSDVAASLAAGFRHHLVKPIDLEALERLLQDASAEFEPSNRAARPRSQFMSSSSPG